MEMPERIKDVTVGSLIEVYDWRTEERFDVRVTKIPWWCKEAGLWATTIITIGSIYDYNLTQNPKDNISITDACCAFWVDKQIFLLT